MWELDRALEDDTRAASLFAWLGAAGALTWLASVVLAVLWLFLLGSLLLRLF